MPLNVAATSVKLAMPPPIKRALFWPSGSAVAHCEQAIHYLVGSSVFRKKLKGIGEEKLYILRVDTHINNDSSIPQDLLFVGGATVFRIIPKLRCIAEIPSLGS